MKKLLAILCAVGMMASMAACGEKDNKDESSTSEVATTAEESSEESSTEEATEESSTEEATEESSTEEATEEATTEEATEEESREIPENGELSFDSVDASALTESVTCGTITFKVNPDWTANTDNEAMMMWSIGSDESGIVVQKMDMSSLLNGMEDIMDTEDILEYVGAGMASAGYEVVSEEFVTLNDTKTYHMEYIVEQSGVKANSNTFMFVGSDNVIYCFQGVDTEGSTEAADIVLQMLSTVEIG